MTAAASMGFMLWDGKSSGTLANVVRLVEQQKPVVVYCAQPHELATLHSLDHLRSFLVRCGIDPRERLRTLQEVPPERALFRSKKQQSTLALEGKIEWDGNLDEMRRGRRH